MDDGTPIKLSVTIDRKDGSAVFDFAGASCASQLDLDAPDPSCTCPATPAQLMLLPTPREVQRRAGNASSTSECGSYCVRVWACDAQMLHQKSLPDWRRHGSRGVWKHQCAAGRHQFSGHLCAAMHGPR